VGSQVIVISLPAHMECAEDGCTIVKRVGLCLMGDGTLRPRPAKDHGWQITYSQNGAFVCRCPKHNALIEQPPAPRMVGVKH
jgi:hypothetical protein